MPTARHLSAPITRAGAVSVGGPRESGAMTSSPAATSPPETSSPATHLVLAHGFWLGGWVWDDVVAHLTAAGLVPHALDLPGSDPALTDADRAAIGWPQQVAAVRAAIERLDGDVVLVGHSGAGQLVQLVVDQDPGRIKRVIYVDSGPTRAGFAVNPEASPTEPYPMPSWSELEADGNSLAGLDDAMRTRIAERAVPEPGRIPHDPIELSNPARLDVPATVICTSMSVAQMQELVAGPWAPVTELGELTDVTYLDLPTSHWPMVTEPVALARVLVAAADAAPRV